MLKFRFSGAAIEEGTLRSGDRLLEVNSTSVDGMTQSEVVSLLRNVEPNSSLDLLVSRHATGGDDSNHNTLKRQSKLRASASSKSEPSTPLEPPLVPHLQERPLPPEPRAHSLNRVGVVEDMEEDRTSQFGSNGSEASSSAASAFQFPWKQREILTFDIPVHDTERAGLGDGIEGGGGEAIEETEADDGSLRFRLRKGGSSPSS